MLGLGTAKASEKSEILLREIAKLEQDSKNYSKMIQIIETKIYRLKNELDILKRCGQ